MVHGRASTFHLIGLLAALVSVLAVSNVGFCQPPRLPPSFLADAELSDVFFLNPDHGWAVGDRGAIWCTEDGGRHWHLQMSPVPCRLESVCFIDDLRGWIVGGWSHPYTHRTSGVILHTRDGGQRWEVIPRLSLPALRRVKFFDARQGWAIGDASSLYPAGIYRTSDGGLSWSSVSAASRSQWLTGDFFDANNGVAGGRDLSITSIHNSKSQASQVSATGARSIRCARLNAPSPANALRLRGQAAGWAVGDGGLVLYSPDGGDTWLPPAGRLPGGMAEYFDFSAVAVLGQQCWIVGAPGSRVLHSDDGGQSWHLFDTKHSLPLKAITFLDEHRGWAVGSMGSILATRDGGRSWIVQQQGGSRAAWLAIASRAEDLPIELCVDLSGNEGFLGAAEVLTQPAESEMPLGQSHLETRLCEAVSGAGGSSANLAWQFPLPVAEIHLPTNGIVRRWDALHQSQSQRILHQYLVRKIRQWRPEVIVTDPTNSRDSDGATHLISQAVLSAVDAAANPTAEADMALVTGLGPWEVKKVFGYQGRDQSSSVNLITSQLAPQLGQSLADHARNGWQLLHSEYQTPAETLGFQLMINRLPVELGKQSFFSGISLQPGREARRQLGAPPPKDIHHIGRMIQQRRNIERLIQYASASPNREASWLGQVENLTRDLDPVSSGQILFELASSLQQSGQLELTAEVYELLLSRYPAHPLSEAAAIWMVQFSASSEARIAYSKGNLSNAAPAVAIVDPRQSAIENIAPATYHSSLSSPKVLVPEVVTKSAETNRWKTRRYLNWIHEQRPALYVEPTVRFPWMVTERTEGTTGENEGYLNAMVSNRLQDAWWSCAKSEFWLAEGRRMPPKPVTKCIRGVSRPVLDGRLNDQTWQDAMPLSLVSGQRDDAHWPAAVMLSADEEFLYIAASCRKPPEMPYPQDDSPRPRDPDLSGRDRIDLLIDVDRDYTSYFHLTVDYRGWACDRCLGSSAWNPQWYIASAQTDESWTVECAIAWSELSERVPTAGDCWALGVQRIAPGGGFQAWNHPATPAVRGDGFGLLCFE